MVRLISTRCLQGRQMSVLKISRLEGLTDGVFAIAMTILVLDLRFGHSLSKTDFSKFLLTEVLYKIFIYIGSFIILGTLWIAINFQQGLLQRLNRMYLWSNIIYLMTICIIPFSASLVANYPNDQASVSFFAVNLLCASMGQLLVTQCAHHYHLYQHFYNNDIRYAIIRRIFVAPAFYAVALFVNYWNTHAAFLILVMPILIYIKPGKVDTYYQVDETNKKR